MPTYEEKKVAVEQIRTYCREYAGRHQAFLERLLDSVEMAGGATEDVEGRIDAQYRTAISALLSLVDRPNADTLDRTLRQINERTNMSFHDVELVGGARDGRTLSELLRKPSKRSARRAKILDAFKRELLPDYQVFREGERG